jgi:hypothetical protein
MYDHNDNTKKSKKQSFPLKISKPKVERSNLQDNSYEQQYCDDRLRLLASHMAVMIGPII